MQTSPSEFLLDHLPRDTQPAQPISQSETPLHELLDARSQPAISMSTHEKDGAVREKVVAAPGIHAHVNRVLQKWSALCVVGGGGVTKGLSSHSFRRGAAQNANRNSRISTPWILDTVSKAFNYIVSTTHEDQQVAKTLAGWAVNAKAQLPTLECFDEVVLHRISRLQSLLFGPVHGFTSDLSLRDDVVQVLMAVALLYYPDMLELGPGSPYTNRVQQAMGRLQIHDAEMTAWSGTIHSSMLQRERGAPVDVKSGCRHEETKLSSTHELLRKQSAMLVQQSQLITGLVAEVRSLSQRVERLEGPTAKRKTVVDHEGSLIPSAAPEQPSVSTRSHSRAKQLSCIWYEWFCDLLPFSHSDRRRYHECKVAVAFTRIFLPGGFNEAKARILELGRTAETNIRAFLEEAIIKAKSVGTIVKILKRMHTEGKLNHRIEAYQRLVNEGRVVDVTPPKSLHVLLPRYT